MIRREAARGAGALLLAACALALLRWGGVSWAPAALLAGAAACFALWRTIPGALTGFAMMATGAALAAPSGGLAWAPALQRPVLGLAAFALGSLGVTAATAERGQPSRRLVGAVLAPCGLLLAGLVLASAARTAATGGALVAGALAYWMGAVPAFAWAPLLLRHEKGGVVLLGLVAWLATALVLSWAVPRLPSPGAARALLLVLGGVTMPWGAVMAWRHRATDPRCARSYLLVVAGAVLALAIGSRVMP